MKVATPDVNQLQPTKAALRPLDIVSRGWSWLFLFVLIIFFSFTGQGFLNVYNFQTIGADMALVLIMALGQTFVILSGGIDLSVGFVMGMASVAAALVMNRLGGSAPLFFVVLAGLAVGLGVGFIPGLVNGLIIARLRVPPFIVTLGMYGIARGAGFILSGGQPVSIQTNGIGQISNGAADVGDPLLLTSIAAVIIGGASLFGGEGTILGTVIGALIIAIIQNGLIFLGINPFWQFIAVGGVIILAVLVDQAKKRLV